MARPLDAMTIDDLVQRSGTPSTTIRMYQAKGLLPGPEREGGSATTDVTTWPGCA